MSDKTNEQLIKEFANERLNTIRREVEVLRFSGNSDQYFEKSTQYFDLEKLIRNNDYSHVDETYLREEAQKCYKETNEYIFQLEVIFQNCMKELGEIEGNLEEATSSIELLLNIRGNISLQLYTMSELRKILPDDNYEDIASVAEKEEGHLFESTPKTNVSRKIPKQVVINQGDIIELDTVDVPTKKSKLTEDRVNFLQLFI